MEQIHEIRVEEYDRANRVMNLVKEFLLKNEKVNIVAGTNSSPAASKAAESLVRYGYVTIENIQTLTEVNNNRRNIKLIISLKKTNDFQKIYDQNKEDIKKKEEERAKKALDRVWLKDKLNSKPNELSWWQQQRIAIARALAINPAIILADEPTWALDTNTGNEVMDLITELWQEWKTVVVITHEQEIADYAKRHILVKDGNIVNTLESGLWDNIEKVEHERKRIFGR